VRKRTSLISACLLLGFWTVATPAFGQALVPHTLNLNFDKLEQQGVGLVQEATQLAQFQQYEPALGRARLATQLAPNLPEAWAILGGLYLQSNELDKSIPALQRANSLNPKNTAVLFALGSAHFQKAKYPEAVDYIEAGLKIKPDVPAARFDLGNAYLMQKKFAEAIANYEKAFAQDKEFWPAINNIGLIKYENGDIDGAIKLWQTSVSLDAKAAEPKLAAAVALYQKGEREQALSMGESAIRIDRRYGDLKFLKENLWGEKLLAATQKFLALPRIKAALSQIKPSSDGPTSSAPK
jgi:tetratricopeptide (TPR) repeat protein